MGRGSSKAGAGTASGRAGGTQGEPLFRELPESAVTAGRVTKASQEMFRDNYTNLRILASEEMERGNYDTRGYTRLDSPNDAVITMPQLRGMRSLVESEWRSNDTSRRLNVIDNDRFFRNRYALTMFAHMINSYHSGMYGG